MWKLFFAILIFATIIVLVFIIFQIALLGRFYRSNKINRTTELIYEVSAAIENQDIQNFIQDESLLVSNLEKISLDEEAAIYLYAKPLIITSNDKLLYSNTLIYKTISGGSFNKLEPTLIDEIWRKAKTTSYDKFYAIISVNPVPSFDQIQILSVESPKKEKKNKTRRTGPIEIEKIIKFFSIAILLFGVFMIGSGSYSMYQDSKSEGESNKPTIEIKEDAATEITLQISSNKELTKVTYHWNNEDEIEIDTKGKKKVEQKIEIPTGKNTLNIYAVDVNGKESTCQRQYTIQGDINVELKVEGNNIKITANGKEQLSYMTYRWDDDEETKVDINSMQTEQTIETPKGTHTLTVVMVDINNKTETKTQEVKGVTKPKVEITTDGSANFIINASDEEGIKKVEFVINKEEQYVLNLDQVLPLEQRKEFQYSYPLKDGENNLKVIVYNESNISETYEVVVRK